MTTRFARWTAALAAAGLLLAACSTQIDTEDLENQIAEQIGDQSGISDLTADCPDDIEAEEGKKFTCDLSAPDGQSAVVEVTLTDDEGGFEAEVIETSGGDDSAAVDQATLESEIKAQLESQPPDVGPIEISCPDDVAAGTQFSCTLTADDGSTAQVDVTVDEAGGFEAVVVG